MTSLSIIILRRTQEWGSNIFSKTILNRGWAVVLPEDPNLFSCTSMRHNKTACNSSSREFNALYWSSAGTHAHYIFLFPTPAHNCNHSYFCTAVKLNTSPYIHQWIENKKPICCQVFGTLKKLSLGYIYLIKLNHVHHPLESYSHASGLCFSVEPNTNEPELLLI